ncbi:MAG TPA: hypothetical protein P5514_14590 [Bacteroidales bacterium]|nr:hypothetical protein [Bacteroidales bacterium]HRX98174.1 hypothetical protein [Bacteroidales bacterium]
MKKFWKISIPILTAAIGVVIGGLVDWTKENSLESKKFEYRLIENALNENSVYEASSQLNFLLDIGMITSVDTAVLRDKINEEKLPVLGNYLFGYAFGNMAGILGSYYLKTKQLPANIEEFDKLSNFALHYQILGKQNVKYFKVGDNDFQLIFYGPDNIPKTEDDKVYTMKDLKLP